MRRASEVSIAMDLPCPPQHRFRSFVAQPYVNVYPLPMSAAWSNIVFPSSETAVVRTILGIRPNSDVSLVTLLHVSWWLPSLPFIVLAVTFASPMTASVGAAAPAGTFGSFGLSAGTFSRVSYVPASVMLVESRPSANNASAVFECLFVAFYQYIGPSHPFDVMSGTDSVPFLTPFTISTCASPGIQTTDRPGNFLH